MRVTRNMSSLVKTPTPDALQLSPSIFMFGEPQISPLVVNVYLRDALTMSDQERFQMIRQLSIHPQARVLVRFLLHSYYPQLTDSFIRDHFNLA